MTSPLLNRPASPGLTRRTLLRAWLALPASVLLAACGGQATGSPTTAPLAQPTATPAAQAQVVPTQPAPTAVCRKSEPMGYSGV